MPLFLTCIDLITPRFRLFLFVVEKYGRYGCYFDYLGLHFVSDGVLGGKFCTVSWQQRA